MLLHHAAIAYPQKPLKQHASTLLSDMQRQVVYDGKPVCLNTGPWTNICIPGQVV